MPAFFVATVSVKNPEKMKEYAAKSGPTFAAFGGTLLARGGLVETLTGAAAKPVTAVVQFPDAQAVSNWYASDDYQALIALREEAADMDINVFATPE